MGFGPLEVRVASIKRKHPLKDSKSIHRALFGVYYEEDIYEQFCRRFPRLMRLFFWRINPKARQQGVIFVHVPRVAGTSISHALYGPRNTLHHSIRYYKTVNPGFHRTADSFALLRDPFEHFASTFAFVRAGGTQSCRMSDVFVAQTAGITTVDDYLAFLEARDPLSLDFVMRPQSWFVTDLKTGAVLVRDLFILGEDMERLRAYLARHGVKELPWLNRSGRVPLELTPAQKARVEALYAKDFALVEVVRAQRSLGALHLSTAAQVVAGERRSSLRAVRL